VIYGGHKQTVFVGADMKMIIDIYNLVIIKLFVCVFNSVPGPVLFIYYIHTLRVRGKREGDTIDTQVRHTTKSRLETNKGKCST